MNSGNKNLHNSKRKPIDPYNDEDESQKHPSMWSKTNQIKKKSILCMIPCTLNHREELL